MLQDEPSRLGALQANPTDGYRRGVLALIGNTPMVRLRHVADDLPDSVEVYAKLEYFNPGGSVKDRTAFQIVADALADGRLRPGKTLIDATSGNTGVAYAMIGAALGIQIELVMPRNVSPARKELASAYGAKITYSSELEGSDGAIRLVRDMVADDDAGQYFYPDQYSTPSNPRAHYFSTGIEVWEQTEGRVTHFVAGLGTSGTVMGTAARLHEYNPNIQIVALEPADSFHGLEGLKHMASSIIPAIYNPNVIHRTLGIDTEAAWDMQSVLGEREGIAVGMSGGAAVVGALRVARELTEGVVVTILPDSRERYVGEGFA